MNPEEKRIEKRDVKQVLKQRANLLARRIGTEIVEGEFLNLLSFQLGEDRYALELKYVQEVQPLQAQMWSLVPCTPGFIVGAVNLRGRIFSMMHIGRFLGVNTPLLMDAAHVILVKGANNTSKDEMEFCLFSEDIPQIKKILQNSIQKSSTSIPHGHQENIRGVTEDMLLVLNMERVFSDTSIIVQDGP